MDDSYLENAPHGRKRITWWRNTKRERGSAVAAMNPQQRHAKIQRLHHERRMIQISYNSFLNHDIIDFHISDSIMVDAQKRRREHGFASDEHRFRHRSTILGLRETRLFDGGPLARLERSIETNPPFIHDVHSGYIGSDEHLCGAVSAGIEFSILVLIITEARATEIVKIESRLKHSGYWYYEVDKRDRYPRHKETVRMEFLFSHPTDLMWFKMRYA